MARGQTGVEYTLLVAGATLLAVVVAANLVSIQSSTVQEVNELYAQAGVPVSDTLGPSITIDPLDYNTTIEAGVEVKVTATDSSDVNYMTVKLTGDSTLNVTVPGPSETLTYSFTPSCPKVICSYTLTVVATDTLGNTSSRVVSFTVTATPSNNPPSITITSPSNGQTFTASSFPYSVTIQWSASDPDGDSLTFSVDCQNDGTYEITGLTSTSYSCSYSAAGTYTVKVTASDGKGGAAFDTVTFTVNSSSGGSSDTTPPTITSFTVSPTSGDTSTTFTISCSASDSSGISWTMIYVDDTLKKTCYTSTCSYSSTYSAGTHTTYCKATDNAGNSATSSTKSFTVSSSSGGGGGTSCTDECDPNNYPQCSDKTLYECYDSDGDGCTELVSTSVDCCSDADCPSGPYQYKCVNYQCVIDSGDFPSIEITGVDTGDLSATVFVSASDDVDLASVKVDCDGDGSYDKSVTLSGTSDKTYDGYFDCTYSSPGYYTIKVAAVDVGGKLATDSKYVQIKEALPTVSVSVTPTSGDTSTTFTISCSASDSSGISWTMIYVDDTLKKTCYTSTCSYSSTYSAGTHTTYCKAQDGAGNVGTSEEKSFTVYYKYANYAENCSGGECEWVVNETSYGTIAGCKYTDTSGNVHYEYEGVTITSGGVSWVCSYNASTYTYKWEQT